MSSPSEGAPVAEGGGETRFRSSTAPAYVLVFLAVILIAIGLRVPDLSRRPMHTDEAVHAVKFGMLLEDGFYRYDRTEYHGPTLNYFTLIPAWMESAVAGSAGNAGSELGEISEVTLRIVPVTFGIGLLLLLLLVPGLSREVVVAAGFFTAVSPAMVFYSRYYIQETLLVFFAFGVLVAGCRYARNAHAGWAVAMGVFAGLMHATKETAVIALGAMVLALGLTLVTRGSAPVPYPRPVPATLVQHGLIALITAASVSALFYSSFLTHPAGVLDSYTTYASYLGRAQHEWHIHPWYYYVELLVYFRGPSGPLWSEALILLLAGVGVVTVATKKHIPGVDADIVRFLSFYSIALLIIYSAIPYKTPWNMLGALHGLIILAGVGVVAALNATRSRFAYVALGCALAIGGAHLARQSYLGSNLYYADPNNPYVYAHPTDDVMRIAERIQALADVHPDGNDMYIEVISPASDYWPLPWYLRSFPNAGWWEQVDMEVPAAPVIIAAPSVEADVLRKLYELPPPGEKYLYVPLFESTTEIRPTIEIHGYVRKDLWDAYLRNLQSLQTPDPDVPSERTADATTT